MRSLIVATFAVAAISFTLGCGSGSSASGKVSVKGKLVEGGNSFVLDKSKLKLPPGASGLPPGARLISISFTPVAGGETAPATVDDSNGTFTVNLVPGQYKISINAGLGSGSADYFGGKYSTDKTQIKRDVKEGEEVVIDITKPQG